MKPSKRTLLFVPLESLAKHCDERLHIFSQVRQIRRWHLTLMADSKTPQSKTKFLRFHDFNAQPS